MGLVPGRSLHDELDLLVAGGLTPYQALLTGTRNALPKRRLSFYGRHRMRIQVLDEISPARFADLNANELTEYVRQRIKQVVEAKG